MITRIHTIENESRSLDVSKAEKVVEEIKAAGGDAIAVGGDVSADEFPDVIVKAAVEYVHRPWTFSG